MGSLLRHGAEVFERPFTNPHVTRTGTMGVDEREVAPGRDSARARATLVGVRALDRLSVWDEAVRARLPFSALVNADVAPDDAPGDGSHVLVRPAILGFIAIVAITIGVAQGQSPFTLKAPGAWFFGVPTTTTSGHSHASTGLFFGLVAVYGGLVLLMRVWYGLIRTLSQRPGVPVRKLMAVVALWVLPLLIVAPLFSRDVYSYAAQGEMMSHHINPYHYGPGVLGAAPAVSLVDPLWVNTPAPYGPLFMQADGMLTSLSLHHELPDVILLRLLAMGGVALMALGVSSLARSYRRDPAYVLTLAILNPITVLHLVGGAHNDAIMLGLLVCGIAAARRGRPLAGIVLCALAAAIKVPAAIGILYVAWEWMGPGIPLRSRVRPLLTAGLISGGILGALSLITGLGWSWVLNLGAPGTVRSWVAPATGAGILASDAAHVVGLGVSLHTMLSITRAIGLGAALCVGLWLLWRSEKIGSLQAIGLTLLLVVALGPVVQPWYLSWGLVLLAPVATGRIRSLIIGLSVCSAFIGLPGGQKLVGLLLHADPLQIAVALLVCLGIFTVPLTPVQRQRLAIYWRRRGRGPAAPPEVDGSPELDYLGA
jgi:alpha-1,6-mannosyltransferase